MFGVPKVHAKLRGVRLEYQEARVALRPCAARDEPVPALISRCPTKLESTFALVTFVEAVLAQYTLEQRFRSAAKEKQRRHESGDTEQGKERREEHEFVC
jgi:hypothetical protein